MTLVATATSPVQAHTDLVKDFFARVKDYVRVVDVPFIDDEDRRSYKIRLKDRLTVVTAEIIRITKIIEANDFLPFENGLLEYQKTLAPLLKLAERLEMATAGYRYWMDPGFLSMTQPDTDLPLFMVLDVDSNKGFSISIRTNRSRDNAVVEFSPKLPAVITEQYLNAIKGLRSYASYGREVTVSIHADYSGVMPSEIRAIVRKAQNSGLFRDIFVVAEAPTWEIDVVVHVKTDPLIIGVTKHDTIFFLGQYDPTPAEKMVSDEFTILT